MTKRNVLYFLLVTAVILAATSIPIRSTLPGPNLIVGRNVNMVEGQTLPDGDPYLQRQNEPSMAVSTRNPLHILAGANDYRTVGFPQSEGPIPGQITTSGDAWLGLFKSFNGGQSWKSTLLPGFPQDISSDGMMSPLYGLDTACDPTVRAGANGLFYYSGIAFDRVENGRGILFVARFIDNNFTSLGNTDPIKYLDTTIIDEGTPGQFADKPWIAVDTPRYGADTIPISTDDPVYTNVQNVARHNVYIVYSMFMGSDTSQDHSKILFARSTDCGTTWEPPVKISEGQQRNQGTCIAVSPQDGTIYIAWRRFATPNNSDAIMMCQSTDFGSTFSKAAEVAPVNPFDQYVDFDRIRSYAFPTLAVDDAGIVYVAWADRGYSPPGEDYARIVIATSPDGTNWNNSPQPIDVHIGTGHQIMPTLTYAAGRLMMSWYDTRKSEGCYDADGNYYDSYYQYIADPGPGNRRHTMDVRAAQALPALNPVFTDIAADTIQVSKYLHHVKNDSGGNIIYPIEFSQMEFNAPNLPLFAGGTIPFVGDYIDITPAPSFLYDPVQGSWRFNTDVSDPSIFHVTWTDNRDVHPYIDEDAYYAEYNPPDYVPDPQYELPTQCSSGENTGTRNQNIYTAPVTQGVMVGCFANTKPLDAPRTFLAFVRNLTDDEKHIRLTIEAPDGMLASFWPFEPPPQEECEYPYLVCENIVMEMIIDPYSTVSHTVFVQEAYLNPYATFKVRVEEIEGDPQYPIFHDFIVLNPDPVNTETIPVLDEYHTLILSVEGLTPQDFYDPSILSAGIYEGPDVPEMNPDVLTPTFRSPTFRSPTFRSGSIANPTFRSTSIGDEPTGGTVTDLQWTVTNNKDTTSAYSFVPIGDVPEVPYQLLIYRVHTSPASQFESCQLQWEEHHELIGVVESPTFRSPTFRSPTFRSPTFRSNTFSLAPGETAICSLRFVEQTPPSPSSSPPPSPDGDGTLDSSGTTDSSGGTSYFDPDDYSSTVAGAVVPQAPNPDGTIDFATSLYIIEEALTGSVNDPYNKTLEAYGGTPYDIDYGDPNDPDDDVWLYQHWTEVLKPGESLPPGLTFSDGVISGVPAYDPTASYPKDYYFTAEVKDESTPQQTARRTFKITINCAFYTITPFAGPGGSISPSDPQTVPQGEDVPFTITPADCFHVKDVIVDKDTSREEHLGPVTTHTFTNVRADHTIDAVFERDTFTITATAGEGGSITPSGDVIVDCGLDQTFTISVDEGYMLEDVVVDKGEEGEEHLGPVTTHTFTNVRADHTIEAIFKPLEKWVKRYNNDPVNDNDEASDLALGPSGNVYVTGYSIGKTSGEDFYTIQYDSEGIEGWNARYDGPSHLGDYTHAIVVDALGNSSETGISYRGNVHKHADYCTVRYNGSGEEVWDAQYDARRNGNDVATAVALDSAGNVYITGRSEYSLDKKSEVLHHDFLTIKYDADRGRIAWQARYDNTSVENAQDEAAALAVDSAGNTYVTGRSQGNGTGFDLVTIKYDSSGNEEWVHRYNNDLVNGNDEAVAIALDSEENIYVTGRSEGTEYDYVTIKYLASGDIDTSWGTIGAVRFDGGYNDEARAIAVDSAGNVYVTGRSQGSDTGFDYVTIKYDSSGNEEWVHRYNNEPVNGNDEASDMVLDSEGNVYVTGRSQGSGTGFDYCTIKYDSSGNMIWRVRYNHSDSDDEARAVVVDSAGNVYVTGKSKGNGTGFDYATVKYEQ